MGFRSTAGLTATIDGISTDQRTVSEPVPLEDFEVFSGINIEALLEDDTGLEDIFTNYIVSGRSEMADVSFSGPVQFMPNGAVDPNSDYSRIGQPNRGRTPRRTLTVGYTPRASVSVEVGIRANNITPIEGGRAFRYHARMFCMMRTAQDHRHDVIHVPVPVTLGGENVTLGGEQVFI